MNKLNKLAAASITILLLNIPAMSAAEEKQKLNPWTQCGIGAMIFSDTQWAAASSNIIWDLGTTAVTSAGVSDHTCNGSTAVVAARFINETYASLEEETVKADGQHVTALLNILGCEGSAHAAIIGAVRADFTATISQPDYMQKTAQAKAETYYNIVQSNATGEFAQNCQVI